MTISTEQFNVVNVGTTANDGTGDSLRAAFVKINDNFANISDIGFDAANINVSGSVEAEGNITAEYFIGDGSQLTNVSGDYNDADVEEYLPTYSGNIANISVTGNLVINDNYVPIANTDPGTPGQIVWDEDYVYICIAEDSWKRANLAAW